MSASAAVGSVDLSRLVAGMAERDQPRSEANVQSDLHTLLLAAPLSLHDQDLEDQVITLEKQAGERRRIDVEVGQCVFEVKRDLRVGKVRAEAREQLTDYVVARTTQTRQRYVGVLTDGAEWRLYHLLDGALTEISTFEVDPDKPDVDGLCVWLESVLSTATAIVPLPEEIERRLGATSAGHKLDVAELTDLYARHRELPTVKLKRELWARLLTSAYGTAFTDDDALFVEHTLLVTTAEIIAHCVIGLDPTNAVAAAAVLRGQLFDAARIHGVVEADFFDWVVEVDGGESFVRGLARRISRFSWRDVEHDVLKVLYESVISTAQRKQLGEYYTPDWLADRVIDAAVTQPLAQRVLDPSCGSGTFLFHAIRRYLAAADAQGLSNEQALSGVTHRVIGMDLHPVAVTFARVTYLLAIGPDRLKAPDRPEISVPVYLGDSIQWGQERTLFAADAISIPLGGKTLFATELRFPKGVLADAARFDRLVSALTDLATRPASARSDTRLEAVLRQYGVGAADKKVLAATFQTLCALHDSGRNHIWGYYVRNLARPVWLSREENRVDVLVGNPPWLSYRFMTADMQVEFRRLSEERGLWAGAAVATNQDLSAVFVLRSIERYLKKDGRFGFVMPWSVLRGRQFAGFRKGDIRLKDLADGLRLSFGTAWDLHGVKPAFFPVPACVVSGTRADEAKALGGDVELWGGRLPRTNVAWAEASTRLERREGEVRTAQTIARDKRSDYHGRFIQGATVVPRVLFAVEQIDPGPLGAGKGRIRVRSVRSANEKQPWKSLPSREGFIEMQFVRKMHLGQTVLPYRPLKPLQIVVPWDGRKLLDCEDPDLIMYGALERWWEEAEALWEKHRSSDRLTLTQQLDYRRKFSGQFPIDPLRVVYSKSGMYLSAAVVTEPAVIDHTLYWGVCSTLQEARYLVAVLNSDSVTARVRPLQARGEHNPRHFDKYVWQLPIPEFVEDDPLHLRLASLSEQAEQIAAAVELAPGKRFETWRRLVRQTVTESEVGQQIEAAVDALLSQAPR